MTVYTYTTTDDPSAVTGTTEAEGINDAGQIVGDYQDAAGPHGYIFSGGIFTTLNDPLGVKGTIATGINDTGQIVGFYIDAGGLRMVSSTTAAPTRTSNIQVRPRPLWRASMRLGWSLVVIPTPPASMALSKVAPFSLL